MSGKLRGIRSDAARVSWDIWFSCHWFSWRTLRRRSHSNLNKGDAADVRSAPLIASRQCRLGGNENVYLLRTTPPPTLQLRCRCFEEERASPPAAKAQRKHSIVHPVVTHTTLPLSHIQYFLPIHTKSIKRRDNPDDVNLHPRWCEAAWLLLECEKSWKRCERCQKYPTFTELGGFISLPVFWGFSFFFFIDSAHERRLENFTPTGRQIRVTFPGWKANTGVIGLCAWLLFLLISCAISLADEKTGRCHRSWRRYHQADARVCQAISYWWISEAAVMFVMEATDILCGVQIVYWLIIDDVMHSQGKKQHIHVCR